MYFSQALTVALSLSAAAVNAAPTRIKRSNQENSVNMMVRSVPDGQLAARDVAVGISSQPLQVRGFDSFSHYRRAIDLRFGNPKPEARDLAMITELHRRGLLDQLIAAIRDLIITLLGKGGGMTRRQASADQIEQAIHQVTCILDALFGNTDDSCSDVLGGSTNSTNATTAAANKTLFPLETKLHKLGQELRNGTSITQVVDGMMHRNQTATSTEKTKGDKKKKKHHDQGAKNATSDASTASTTVTAAASGAEKRSYELLEARQNSGVEGLLVSLRDVIDTILNTLLPMSSRSDETPPSNSSAAWPPQNCPPPTPNDGMYRPGCPGYGRRDIAIRRSISQLGERDANILQTLLPMIQMLVQELPSFISSLSSSPTSTAANATSTAASAAGAAKGGSPTTFVDEAFAQIMSALGYGTPPPSPSSKTASTAASGGSSAARSAANLSQNVAARDLLDGDGMNLGHKRQADPTDATGAIGSDNCDASGNSGGINVSLLNNLLNGLLGGLTRRSEDAEPLEFFKRQADGTDDGLIGTVNCNASNNTGGINLSLLDNLLNGLLFGLGRRDVGPLDADPLAARSVPEHLLQVRADFAPVWTEIKKIGNEQFHVTRDVAERDVQDDDAPNFTPVWEAFRDLVDSGYSQAAAAAGATKRDTGAPLKLDYKPLMKAGIKFGKQVFKTFTSGTKHAKRSQDFRPFIDAASNFAATAIKEMFVKSS